MREEDLAGFFAVVLPCWMNGSSDWSGRPRWICSVAVVTPLGGWQGMGWRPERRGARPARTQDSSLLLFGMATSEDAAWRDDSSFWCRVRSLPAT